MRTASGSFARVAPSASDSATRTPRGSPERGQHPEGGGFYGHKLHAAVCARTGLPLAWAVHTARTAELHPVPSLLDGLKARGFAPATAAMDKGYDYAPSTTPAPSATCSRSSPAAAS